MLFIDDCKTEVSKGHSFLDQGMGADGDIDLSVQQALLELFLLDNFQRAGQEFNSQAKQFRPALQIPVMLFRQDFCGSHHRGLVSVFTSDDHRRHGNDRLSGTYIPL
ncbi:MAG: hypothetical protein ACD_87C00169G0001 [uncultured bacterium]|nr:MAG: hypothetical protein ACD_87C00169G0001 [uncultured bacterium]